jgi:hypothetical protein
MKIKNIALATTALFMIIMAVACSEKNVITPLGEEAKGARVKFINACSNCPTVHVKVGDKVVTGATLGFGGVFPNVGYALYSPGDVNFTFVQSDLTTNVLAGKVSTADGKYYTVILNDTVPVPSILSFEDPVNDAREDTVARIRFLHSLTSNDKTPKDTLDVVRKIDNAVVFSGITYGTVTPFSLKNQGNTPDSFFIRKKGTTTAYPGLGAAAILTWAKGRTYTLYARGVSGKTAATQVPRLDFYTNK